MEGVVERNLRELLKSRAPNLYDSLSQSGELEHFIYYKAAAISNEVSHQRYREEWDYLPHQELVHRLKVARSAATEAVLGDLLAQDLVAQSNAERALAL
jgi:hypothetical protein